MWRQALYTFLIGLIVVWTGVAAYQIAPVFGEPDSGLIVLMAAVYWSIVVVPLGIFALIAKPR